MDAIRQLPLEFILLLGSIPVGVVIALLIVLLFRKRARQRRVLRKSPWVRVAEAADGQLAKLTGRLIYATAPLTAPLSGRPCALYEVTVREPEGELIDSMPGGRPIGPGGRALIHAIEHCPQFLIDDGSGQALVSPDGAEVVLVMDGRHHCATFVEPTPRMEAFLAAHGQSARWLVFNRTLYFNEGALEQGETVFVFGRCRRTTDPNGRALLQIAGDQGNTMILSDVRSFFP